MSIVDILYISKGQFRKLEPSFQVQIDPKRTETVYIGGYNPADPGTAEYYTLRDSVTHNAHFASADLHKVLRYVPELISMYGDESAALIEAVRQHTVPMSAVTLEQERRVYEAYGDYYRDAVQRAAVGVKQ